MSGVPAGRTVVAAALDSSLTSLDWMTGLKTAPAAAAGRAAPHGDAKHGGNAQTQRAKCKCGAELPSRKRSATMCGGPAANAADAPVTFGADGKPNLSYADMIKRAIGSAPSRRATLNYIYKYITDNFSYYAELERNNKTSWKNSIRHNLSLNKLFVKVQRAPGDHGKGNYWVFHESYANRVYGDGDSNEEPRCSSQCEVGKRKRRTSTGSDRSYHSRSGCEPVEPLRTNPKVLETYMGIAACENQVQQAQQQPMGNHTLSAVTCDTDAYRPANANAAAAMAASTQQGQSSPMLFVPAMGHMPPTVQIPQGVQPVCQPSGSSCVYPSPQAASCQSALSHVSFSTSIGSDSSLPSYSGAPAASVATVAPSAPTDGTAAGATLQNNSVAAVDFNSASMRNMRQAACALAAEPQHNAQHTAGTSGKHGGGGGHLLDAFALPNTPTFNNMLAQLEASKNGSFDLTQSLSEFLKRRKTNPNESVTPEAFYDWLNNDSKQQDSGAVAVGDTQSPTPPYGQHLQVCAEPGKQLQPSNNRAPPQCASVAAKQKDSTSGDTTASDITLPGERSGTQVSTHSRQEDDSEDEFDWEKLLN